MKKILPLFSAAILLFLATGCSLDVSVQSSEPDSGLILHANYFGDSITKTEFGLMTSSHKYAEVLWSENDEIKLFPDASDAVHLVMYQGNGPSADFKLDPAVPLSGSSFIGLYPYDEAATAQFSGPVVNTVIPDQQTAKVNNFDPLAMLAVGQANAVSGSSGQLTMDFYNVCSGICFSLSENPSQYKRIVFKGNNSEPLAGAVSISLASGASQPLASPADAAPKTSVSLLPPKEGNFAVSSNADNPYYYYITFLPGDFPSGFSLLFYGEGDALLKTNVCNASVSFQRGRFALVNDADKAGKLEKIRNGVPLDEPYGPSNCYIISAPGSYRLPLVKGNDYNEVLVDVDGAAIVWETNNTSSKPAANTFVKDLSVNKGYLYFSTPSSLTNGNALIAAKRGDKIVWSWHIWVLSGYDAFSSSQTLNGKTLPMLDRNLGALSASPGYLSNGFFYQWGRKDPFPGANAAYVAQGGTQFVTTQGAMPVVDRSKVSTSVDWTIANPDTFISSSDIHWTSEEISYNWAKNKTIYDPCPPGWRVPGAKEPSDPSEEAWSGFGDECRVGSPDYGAKIPLDGSGYAWYPTNGFLNNDAKLYMVGQICTYWSYSDYGGVSNFGMMFNQNSVGTELYLWPRQYGQARVIGHSVRCIREL